MANGGKRTVPDRDRAENAATAPDRWARAIVRRALKASLATIHRDTGYPYASLVTVGTLPGGEPLTLISALAEHTMNLEKDPRASLLFDETSGLGDPLEGARVSVFGTMRKTSDPAARARFLSRHPAAAMYAGFKDFAFYALEPEGAHFVGGFGLISGLSAGALRIPLDGAEALLEAEPGIVEHMNEDHADAVSLYATRLLGAPEGDWRFVSCDPEGCDLVFGDRALRLEFPGRVTSPQQVRKVLVELVETARG